MKDEPGLRFWHMFLILAGILLIQVFLTGVPTIREVPFSEFRQMLEQGKVDDIVIGDSTIRAQVLGGDSTPRSEISTNRVDAEIASYLDRYPVRYRAQASSSIVPAILAWAPTLLIVGIWIYALRSMRGSDRAGGFGAFGFGKSKARLYLQQQTGVTFADVAGVDEAKRELQEIVDFLKDPAKHSRLGARLPKGILLVGVPGTGKTLLARAVAGEAGVPFFSIGGSEFVELFVGVGAARVRDLFEQARQHAPCIIFIDELDALGRARGTYALGGHDEKEQTLNQLLAEMDGFDPRTGIVLLAATNRPEILDPALLRAGRFDRQVLVDRPDRKGRIEILGVHMKRVKLAPDIDRGEVAALTPGFTGADLANLVNEATLLATRRGAEAVAREDFVQAIERIVAGLEKRNRVLIPHERQIIAFHESGHALLAMTIPGMDPVQKVSIIPHGISALGYTIQRPTEDRFLMDRQELEGKMVVLLGGRAAEMLMFQSVSTGAADDLQKVTEIARSMVVRYGMAQGLGQIAYEPERGRLLGPVHPLEEQVQRRYSEATAARIDEAVYQIVDEATKRATELLQLNRPLLEELAHKLLDAETLAGGELEGIAKRVRQAPLKRAEAA